MSEAELPKLEGEKIEECFGYHALNYRTAATQHAQAAWEELERFTLAWGRQCYEAGVSAERERAAKIADDMPVNDPDGPWFNDEMSSAAYQIAAAIRKG